MLSSRMTTSRPPSTRRLARSSTISATRVCVSGASSKVELKTSAFDRALHVGDFFGSLTDQRNHQMGIVVIFSDRVGDGLEEHRLTGFRR